MQDQNPNDFLLTKNELEAAINKGEKEVVDELISQGDHIHYILDNYIANDNVEGVKLILAYNFDLNAMYNNGAKALNLAISRGNEEIISLLIKKGASPYDALLTSLNFSNIKEVGVLLREYNPDIDLGEVAGKLVKLSVKGKELTSVAKIAYTLLEKGVTITQEDLDKNHVLKEAFNRYYEGITLEDLERHGAVTKQIARDGQKTFVQREQGRINSSKEDDIRPAAGTLCQ